MGITDRKAAEWASQSLAAIVGSSDDAIVSKDVAFVRLNEVLVSVLEAIADIVFITDPDGTIEFMNPAADRFARALGLHQHLPPPVQLELQSGLQVGRHHRAMTSKRAHRFLVQKEERYLLSHIVTMAANSRVFGAVVMLQDVTELRLLDEMKTNLISTVSHELKTPITSLQTALLLVLDQTLGELNGKQAEMLSIAHDEASRLLRTIETLVALTRFEDKLEGVRLVTVLPEELIQAAVEETRAAAEHAGVSIKLELEADLHLLQVDRERIVQVLTNLLSNAIKYSPRGGQICVRAHNEDQEVYFAVVDCGPGVPEPYQSRVFEKFFRVPGTPKRGVGLGLSVAREFVRAHGGRIGLHSKSGEGCEFYFNLARKAN